MSSLKELVAETNLEEYSDSTLVSMALTVAPEIGAFFGDLATATDVTDIAKLIKSLIPATDLTEIKTFLANIENLSQLNVRVYSLIVARQYHNLNFMSANLALMASLMTNQSPGTAVVETPLEIRRHKQNALQGMVLLIGTILIVFVFVGILVAFPADKINTLVGGCIVAGITTMLSNLSTVYNYIWGGSNEANKPRPNTIPPTPPITK